jgi:LPXTG-motif cell wall-anchored protein
VQVVSPADSATVGPKFTVQVKPTNFTPMTDLEGKPNLKGYGHYHVFVDMNMSAMAGGGEMMSMAGMVLMPGSNTFDVDLSAWPAGKHTLTVELVQNDHTPIDGAKPAMFTINLQSSSGNAGGQSGGAPANLPRTGGDDTGLPLAAVFLGILILVGGLVLRSRSARRA